MIATGTATVWARTLISERVGMDEFEAWAVSTDELDYFKDLRTDQWKCRFASTEQPLRGFASSRLSRSVEPRGPQCAGSHQDARAGG